MYLFKRTLTLSESGYSHQNITLIVFIFRWSGRNHREKIGVHVQFDQMLNMKPYCCIESTAALKSDHFIYDLSAVVMHHGKGFGSGHYTAFCYNPEGGS